MAINAQQLSICTGADMAHANVWLAHLATAMEVCQIITVRRQAAFLAQIGVESGGLARLVENLDYSPERLAAVWPGRYAIDAHAAIKIPNVLTKRLAHQPEALANDVYANRLGNGSSESGEGWKYRGRGLIQVTGKDGYRALGIKLGLDLLNHPELLQLPPNAAHSAARFFADAGCNPLADADQIDAISKRINGGTLGLDARRKLYQAGLAVLGAAKPNLPASNQPGDGRVH